ncbi:hypothetical protein DPMN_033768 [Dreissena polymorpha]|uniref:Uncharacterized protein n=1 Tax=Dreissena polymorpha TaxID=45954 RepID=A0A9D4M6B3_DREPO|nr:hypothetical protein DPMN_033768 [Dreissena polymorpha]
MCNYINIIQITIIIVVVVVLFVTIISVYTSLLSLSPQTRPVTLELLVSVYLPKTGDDEKESVLSGMDFLPDGRLVAVDNHNKKCIILNERLQRLGTPYKFTYSPRSVVCVSKYTLCVTCGDGKVVCLLSLILSM